MGFDVPVPAHDTLCCRTELSLLLGQGAMSGKDPPEHTAYNQAEIDRFSVHHSSEFAKPIEVGSTCSGYGMTRMTMGHERYIILRYYEVHLLFDF